MSYLTKADKIKAELLLDASRKPVRAMKQFDVFTNDPGDSMFSPNEHGDCLFAGDRYELKNLDEIRVFIPVRRTPDEAIRALRALADWIEGFPEILIQIHYSGAGERVGMTDRDGNYYMPSRGILLPDESNTLIPFDDQGDEDRYLAKHPEVLVPDPVKNPV